MPPRLTGARSGYFSVNTCTVAHRSAVSSSCKAQTFLYFSLLKQELFVDERAMLGAGGRDANRGAPKYI